MRIIEPPAQPVYVATIAPGRTLTLGCLPDAPLLVVEDSVTRERLGAVLDELSAFYVEVGGAPLIVLAGVEHPVNGRLRWAGVELLLPEGLVRCRLFATEAANGNRLAGWMSFPQPFEPGMRVTAIYRSADGREVGRSETPPLERADLEPRPLGYGTAFAPTD